MIPCASPVIAELGKSQGDPCLFRAGVRGVVLLACAKVEDQAERVHGGVRPACRFVAEQAAEAGFHVVQAAALRREVEGIQHVGRERCTGTRTLRRWPRTG